MPTDNIRAANADAAAWTATTTDAGQVTEGTVPDILSLLPEGRRAPAEQWDRIKAQVAEAADAADWRFRVA